MEPLGPQPNWAQGVSNSPHGLRTAAYSAWTIGPQRSQKAKKGHILIKTKFCTQDSEKAKLAINSISIKNQHSKGQGPKAMVRPEGGISKVNGDKTP
ncbi:hypothetical protein O181_014125 [Austropuccinia psidii MF-1]|uniref:Uncharacterized protein n=1 Tax=Austropuccinia psidii MF-1 TaxID=1389203 RepID=A0A9Q3C0D3_9BASI|nr:hypothetical protein [Austropuccinia psidii MF-1]